MADSEKALPARTAILTSLPGSTNTGDGDCTMKRGTAKLTPRIAPFAGRIGGNQIISIDDPRSAAFLKETPDALPYIGFREIFDLRPLLHPSLWKYAIIECFGTYLIVVTTSWVSLHPTAQSSFQLTASGVYGTTAFFGPLIGGITNWILLTLFIYSFSDVSGGHLNPTITMATFFARLVSFPRLLLYIVGQTIGGTLAGLTLRTAYGSSDFLAGGCYVDTNLVPAKDAFVLEFVFTLSIIVLSFGVGLDPRQKDIIGPTLGPCLVGLSLGILSFTSAFTRPGYAGASMNPARCFGVFVGSTFPSYHWIHWVGPVAAAMGHGIIYYLVPPWAASLEH